MIPARSPFGLIQEDLWPAEWQCLVACVMLNRTSRKQIEKIIPTFFRKWPNPVSFLSAKPFEVVELISPLGFQNVRTKKLFEMTDAYINKNWNHVSELPGVGDYAARSWDIFFNDDLGNCEPNDGALALYWRWRIKHDS